MPNKKLIRFVCLANQLSFPKEKGPLIIPRTRHSERSEESPHLACGSDAFRGSASDLLLTRQGTDHPPRATPKFFAARMPDKKLIRFVCLADQLSFPKERAPLIFARTRHSERSEESPHLACGGNTIRGSASDLLLTRQRTDHPPRATPKFFAARMLDKKLIRFVCLADQLSFPKERAP